MQRGHMHLTAIIDWFSQKIMGWELSDTLETAPVLDAVQTAVEHFGTPAILNSDQGSQFTSDDYKALLKSLDIRQSMDGRSRGRDHIMIERWFRSLKTELIYINEFRSPRELRQAIRQYVNDYNTLGLVFVCQSDCFALFDLRCLCLGVDDEAVRLFVKRNFFRDGKNQAKKPRGRLKAVFGGR